MRIVNLKDERTVDRMYNGAKFPLFICHSTEEFTELMKDEQLRPKVISNMSEFSEFAKDYPRDEINFVQDKNVWLATHEVYKPDAVISGIITYQIDERGYPIQTDNCYVQLISFMYFSNKAVIATSSGKFNIYMFGEWITAAKKPFDNNGMSGKSDKTKRLKKYQSLLSRKRLSAGDIRFIYYQILPNMPFKSVYQCAHKAYGTTFPKEIIDKLMQTDRIKEALIKEIKKMIPNFDEVLLKVYSLQELASDMKAMVKKTLEVKPEDYDVDATRRALKTVFSAIEAQPIISSFQNQPLVPGTVPQMVSESKAKQIAEEKPELLVNEADIEQFQKEMGVPLTDNISISHTIKKPIIDIPE